MAIVYCSWATGDDTTGTGTAANPYKTITKASASRSAGDEVRVAKSPDPTALTGTTAWTLNSTTVTGTDTLFTTELAIGDFISAPDGNWYEVITIASDTSATLYKKYPSASASGHSSQKLGVTDTGAAASSTTAIQTVSSSGNSTSALIISGGWDLSTETQTGQTWFRQMHGTFNTRNGYGLYIGSKTYTSLDKLNFLRYNYGIYYYSSSNNTITSATCNSNNFGIYYSSSSNNTITSATCNSNNFGIYYSYSTNNTITSATCNSNNSGIYYSTSSNNNTITSATCNSNTNGIYYYNNSTNTITSATCNSNNYGINYTSSTNNTITSATCNSNTNGIYYYNNSTNNNIYALSTTGNTTGAIYADNANNICHNATIAEGTKVALGTAYYSDTRQYINNLGGYSYVYSNYATANSQNATAGGTGKEWKFAITNAARNTVYPFYIPIARVAVGSSGKVTVKVYFKKSGTGIAGGLRCRVGQLAWSDGTNDITVTCPNNTSRNQVTLEFTPTEAGVVEIEAGAWYTGSTTQTVIIDDIEITQA
jgi:parallel beta-helix repeat protein